MKVLVVDDAPDVINIISLTFDLLSSDTVVVSAQDGNSCLEMVAQERPDLVILDVGLPDMDGFQICQELRVWSDVPIIMLTARAGEADQARGLELGADGYITKPFRPNEFIARVQAVMRRSGDGSRNTP